MIVKLSATLRLELAVAASPTAADRSVCCSQRNRSSKRVCRCGESWRTLLPASINTQFLKKNFNRGWISIRRKSTYSVVVTIYVVYTGCNRRNGPDFGRVFLMLNYTEKTPKHLYPQLNRLGDNGQWSLKLWQLLHTYWLPNSYWNWHEYVVSVMLISVLFIKVTCEWHRAINCNCKVHRIRVILKLTVRSTIHHTGMLSGDVTRLPAADLRVDKNPSWQRSFLDPKEVHNFQITLSPKPFNYGYRCFGVFRYSLT